MTVNGYEVEQSATGAWWVQPPGGRQAWRFDTWDEALHFADRPGRRPRAGAGRRGGPAAGAGHVGGGAPRTGGPARSCPHRHGRVNAPPPGWEARRWWQRLRWG